MNHSMNEVKIPHNNLCYDDKTQTKLGKNIGFVFTKIFYFSKKSFIALHFSNGEANHKLFS